MQPIDPTSLALSGEAATRLRADVEFLASHELRGRLPGTAGNRRAADRIEAAFHEAALVPFAAMPDFRQTISSAHGDNILGYRPATGPSLGWILVGAHYDHLGGEFVGADDNASAVAIVMELARTLPPLSNYSVVFVAFNTEENPYFGTPRMGSEFFIAHLPAEIGKLDALQAVIIMDLIGGVQWQPLRDVIFAAGAEKSPGLYRRLKEAVNRDSGKARVSACAGWAGDSGKAHVSACAGWAGQMETVKRETNRSTHDSADTVRLTVLPVGMHLIEEIPERGHHPVSDYDGFRNRSVPYLFLSSARTPRYHTPRDRPATLHYERMAATVQWLEGLLRALDGDREKYAFEPDRIEWEDEVETFRRVTRYAVNDATLIPGTSRLSLRKLRQDAEWLNGVDGTTPTAADLERLERISIRFQCLLADYTGCFWF
ncbi:MAG TPA: M28 family peptidase [Nitrospiraceae bacterium]|nr:M28 family peptidase [Nitrospiraceae bacterium]